MSPAQRRQMVDREHPNLPIVQQCALLGVSRSSLYYRPRAASAEDLSLMGEIDRQYLETPFYGSAALRLEHHNPAGVQSSSPLSIPTGNGYRNPKRPLITRKRPGGSG